DRLVERRQLLGDCFQGGQLGLRGGEIAAQARPLLLQLVERRLTGRVGRELLQLLIDGGETLRQRRERRRELRGGRCRRGCCRWLGRQLLDLLLQGADPLRQRRDRRRQLGGGPGLGRSRRGRGRRLGRQLLDLLLQGADPLGQPDDLGRQRCCGRCGWPLAKLPAQGGDGAAGLGEVAVDGV